MAGEEGIQESIEDLSGRNNPAGNTYTKIRKPMKGFRIFGDPGGIRYCSPLACGLGDEKSVRLGVPFKCLEALPLLGF